MSPAQPGNPAAAIDQNPEIAGDTTARRDICAVAGDDGKDLAAAQAGDHEAFARLYDRHAPVVLSLCRRLSLPEAEDATQETFIRAFRLLHKVHSPDKVRPWLYAIARRVCSERTRSAGRRARHEEHLALTQATQRIAPDDASEQAAHTERLERLDNALEQLDDRERLAIHLYYLEANPVTAATSALGVSRSGYYKLLARAREQLADLMREVNPS